MSQTVNAPFEALSKGPAEFMRMKSISESTFNLPKLWEEEIYAYKLE
jgi:hypothetical protein